MGILKLIKDAFRRGLGLDDRAKPDAPVQMTKGEVDKYLADCVVAAGEPLNVKESVVDLLKALNLDSSLEARQDLASDLGYEGSFEDTAAMNTELHRLLMKDLYAHKFKCD